MFLNNNEQQLNVQFKARHGERLYAGFASTDSLRCFECGDLGHKSFHIHIQAVDNVRAQALVRPRGGESFYHAQYPLWVRSQMTTHNHCQMLPKTLLRAGLSNRPGPGILEGY